MQRTGSLLMDDGISDKDEIIVYFSDDLAGIGISPKVSYRSIDQSNRVVSLEF